MNSPLWGIGTNKHFYLQSISTDRHPSLVGRRSEDWKGRGWYRITGGAGTQLADFVVDKDHCGTGGTGWMEGGHPTVSQGEVTRTVNFAFTNSKRAWQTRIRVINCHTHFVYYLEQAPSCTLGYCTA